MRRWTVLLVVVLSLALFSIIHLYNLSRTPKWDPVCDHASFRTNEWGTKALRELLERSGLGPGSWRRQWTELSPGVKLLWIIDPQSAPSEREAEALVEWIEAGGRAIIAPDPRAKRRSSGSWEGPTANVRLLGHLGWVAMMTGQPERVVQAQARHTLLRNVNEVIVPARWRLKPSGSEDEVRAALKRARRGSFGSREATEAATQIPKRLIQARGEAFLRDSAGVVAARIGHGRGEIILLCDADMISNKWISEADNVLLAANIAFSAADGKVWFDEYHHGRRERYAEDLESTAPSYAIWAALAALALFFLGKFWRFGAPIPADPPPRRSSLEYVRAFASLYRRAGQRRAALEMIVRRFRTGLAFLAGVPADSPPELLGPTVARRSPRIDEGQLTDLLRRCDEAIHGPAAPTDAQLLDLTRAISRIEQELARHDI